MTKANETINAIAKTVINMMEQHGSDWAKPWKDAVAVAGQPVSAKKRAYTGINRFNLGLTIALAGYTSPVFATFKQWKSLGATVKKGSKGHAVLFYKTIRVKDKLTGEEKPMPCARSYTVFNADQVEGWAGNWLADDAPEAPEQAWHDHLSADEFIARIPATIVTDNQNAAFYRKSTDSIHMPARAQFVDASGYYGTLFHELGHWSGHESREDRKFGTRFVDDRDAFEELVAELSAAMLSGLTGVDTTPRDDHAKYLNGWISCLKDDAKAIQKAASLAEKAAQCIISAAEANPTTQAA